MALKGGSNPKAEGAYRDGVNYQSVNVLGYENFQGNKAEWLQYVTENKTAADGRWFITMPDGTERIVQGITVYNADIYPTHMVWGRYMDLIAAKEMQITHILVHLPVEQLETFAPILGVFYCLAL